MNSHQRRVRRRANDRAFKRAFEILKKSYQDMVLVPERSIFDAFVFESAAFYVPNNGGASCAFSVLTPA